MRKPENLMRGAGRPQKLPLAAIVSACLAVSAISCSKTAATKEKAPTHAASGIGKDGRPIYKPNTAQPPPKAPSPSPGKPYQDITPEEAMRRLKSGERIVLMDVRTPEENAEKRIPGAVLIPLGKPGEMSAMVKKAVPDKRTPVFIYCRGGKRSAAASGIMAGLGYTNVYNLGGILSWPYATEP